MSDVTGALAHNGTNTVADAMDAIFSASAPTPPLAPESYDSVPSLDPVSEPNDKKPVQRLFPKASWLDALSNDSNMADTDAERISSVNSDDNGLYRMFIGVSP